MDKKLIKIIGIVIGAFILLLIILMLLVSCGNHKTNYSKVEANMIEAATKYFKANQKELPSEDGSSKDVKLSKLVSDGYIKDPNSSNNSNNGTTCDGYVTVTNNNGYYLFSPKLTCGKDYSTVFLKDKIISDNNNGVESGFGLYQTDNNQYIFKGDTVNNYVTMNDKNYRILRINEDGTIRLMSIDKSNTQYAWDDRYNSDVSSSVGINDYYRNDINSRIKDTLESIYTSSYTDKEKAYITTQTLCVGKRSEEDITKDGSTECSVQLDNQELGLITPYEYMQASLDNGCTETTATSCGNYNWLYDFNSSWTLTGDTERSDRVYVLNKTLRKTQCITPQRVYPVFNLTDRAIYVSGTGTETDPYVFK